MNPSFLALLLAVVFLFASACAHEHTTAGREPAAEEFSFDRTCGKMTREETEEFKAFVLVNYNLVVESEFFREFHHRAGFDKQEGFEGSVDLDFVMNKKRLTESSFDKLSEYVIDIALGECASVRTTMTRDNTPADHYRWMKAACGPEDQARKASSLPHPKNLRTVWTDFLHPSRLPRCSSKPQKEGGENKVVCKRATFNLWDWVNEGNGVIDREKPGTVISPQKMADLCLGYKFNESIEDRAEKYMLCFQAAVYGRIEYDEKTRNFTAKRKKRSEAFSECLKGYTESKVDLANDGTPLRGKKPPKAPEKNSEEPVARSETGKPARTAGVPQKPRPNNGYSTAPYAPSDRAVWKPGKGSSNDAETLPADADDCSDCRRDECVTAFAEKVKYSRVPIPADFSSKRLMTLYVKEKSNFVAAVSKHQLRVLSQGFVVAASERKWDSPADFNKNIAQLSSMCTDDMKEYVRTGIVEKESLGTEEVDGAFDNDFAGINDLRETLGKRMVATTLQIKLLQKLVALLKYESGPKAEIATTPSWWKYLPIVRLFGDAPIGIDFGDVGNFQCNFLATMNGDMMDGAGFPYSSDLIRKADKEIRKLMNDENFRKQAFCTNDNACRLPYDFVKYLSATDPAEFAKVDEQIRNGKKPWRIGTISWCEKRWKAAQALNSEIIGLFSLYPALGHAEKGGASLFDRIHAYPGTLEQKAEYAAKEAARVLPLVQSDILRYFGRVCDDVRYKRMDSTYMSFLMGSTIQGFDYCSKDIKAEKEKDGIGCDLRGEFYACEIKKEAKEWEEEQRVPEFVKQVVMTGLDAMLLFNIANGSLGFMFTYRGLAYGALTGVGFTILDLKVSQMIAAHTTALWDDFRLGNAALMLEGVDSYANAIVGLAEAHPKAEVKDFILGFMMGAMMSGKGKGKAGAPVSGPLKSSKETFEKVADKVAEFSEKTGQGTRFRPESVSKLKSWMMRQAGEDPDFISNLIKNLGEHLNTLTDAEYANLFAGTEGKTNLARVRRAIGQRIKALAPKLTAALGEARKRAAEAKIKKGKFDGALKPEVEFVPEDILAASEKMGPRERATLADAMERVTNESDPKARAKLLDELFKDLCALSASCGFKIRGC